MGDTSLPLVCGFPPQPKSPRPGETNDAGDSCCTKLCRSSLAQCLCPCRGKYKIHHKDDDDDEEAPLLPHSQEGPATRKRKPPPFVKPPKLRTFAAYGFVIAVVLIVVAVYASFIVFNVVPAITKKNIIGKDDELHLRWDAFVAELISLHLFFVLFAVCFVYSATLPPGFPDSRWNWREGSFYPDFLQHIPPIVQQPDLCRELKTFRPQPEVQLPLHCALWKSPCLTHVMYYVWLSRCFGIPRLIAVFVADDVGTAAGAKGRDPSQPASIPSLPSVQDFQA